MGHKLIIEIEGCKIKMRPKTKKNVIILMTVLVTLGMIFTFILSKKYGFDFGKMMKQNLIITIAI